MKKLLFKCLSMSLLLAGTVTITGPCETGTLWAQEDDYVSVSATKNILVNKKQGTALLEENVKVVQESTQSTLTSDHLFIKRDPDTKKVSYAKAEGNVHAIMNKLNDIGVRIRTVDLVCRFAEFDKPKNKAIIKGDVVVESHDFKLVADRVFYDLKTETGTITERPGKQVLMTFIKNATPPNAPQPDVMIAPEIVDGAADEIRFNKPLRKVTFQGQVNFFDHAEQARFTANKADAYFDIDDDLERIVAYENVVITQPKRESRSDRAVFNYNTEIIVLTGNASVKELNQMEMRSSTITMYMNEDKGIISGGEEVPVKAKIKVGP